jgi:TIR domain
MILVSEIGEPLKIFISYRREDSAGHAGRLYDSLKAHFGEESLFMDLTAIESGQNFADVIKAAVGSCDVLIAVIGKEWLTCAGPMGRRLDDPKDFVRLEIHAALERGTPVVPVLVEGAAMPGVDALPDALKALGERNAHELSDRRWSYDVGRLVEATKRLTAPLATTPPPTVRLEGEWSAQVTYSWGDRYTERFTFRVDGNEVLGTASFLGVRRGIRDGTLKGNTVAFTTSTNEVSGDWNNPTDVEHRYRGRISGDVITFYMQSEGGSSTIPIEFAATRVSEGAAPEPRR